METIKVLLFAANPPGTAPLDLAREFREIDEEVGRSPFRSAVELILVPGTRPVDLLRKLNENQPQVVHFSSHGDPDEIVLESDDPEADASGLAGSSLRSADERDMKKVVRPDEVETCDASPGPPAGVSKSALVSVLRSCDEGNLRLVVLNACHTRSQAEALTEVVDCVVSMNRTISDRAAIKFAASFYGALAFGRSVQNAFEQGVARLSAEGIARGRHARAPGALGGRRLPGRAGERRAAPGREAGRRGAVPRAVPAERGFRGPGRRPGAAACQLIGVRRGPGRHPAGGPDRHGGHRQDPARRRVRPSPPGGLPGRHLLDRRGRPAGRGLRPAGDGSPLAVGRDRPAARRADPGGVRGAGRPTARAAGAG